MQFRKKREEIQLSITPLVDIVFLLLIFFLLASSFKNPSIKLSLPEAKNKGFQDIQKIIISVDASNKIFVNNQEVRLINLSNYLKKLMREQNVYSVIFRGDKSISFDTFVKVMDEAKRAGARYIHISHKLLK